MRTIHSPCATIDPADRLGACEWAMEPALWQLLDRAEAAGWSKEEALAAANKILGKLAASQAADIYMEEAKTLAA